MAINFGEVFLRESGATQDRAQSMAEMQLRAKQFADDLAFREAQQEFNKQVQAFNEEEARFQRRQQFLDRAQKHNQFMEEIKVKREEIASREGISEEDRKVESRRLNIMEKQYEAQNNLAWYGLDQADRQFILNYDLSLRDLGIKENMSAAEIENIKARTTATLGQEERAERMFGVTQRTAEQNLNALAISNAMNAIRLGQEKRGDIYAQEQADKETKKLLGLKEEDNLTNERAGLLLQQEMLNESLKQKQLVSDLYEAKAESLQKPITDMELLPRYATKDEQLNFFERQYYKNVIPFATALLTGGGLNKGFAVKRLSEGKTYANLAGRYGVSPEGIKRIYGKTPLELAGPGAEEIYNIATELGRYQATPKSLLDYVGTDLGIQGVPVPFYFQNNILQDMMSSEGATLEE